MARGQEVYSEPPPPTLDCRANALLHASIAGDLVLRTALASVLSTALVRSTISRAGREDSKRLAFYADIADTGDAARVFARPPARVKVATTPRDNGLVQRGRVDVLHFRSPYRALHPKLTNKAPSD